MDTSTSFFWQNAQEADDLKRQVYQEQQAKLQQEADDLKLHQEQQACYDLQQKRQQQEDCRLNELDNERLVKHSKGRNFG
jgi:hypothetical protein